MGQLLADLLPVAVGVLISPLPIIATILVLFSARARVLGPVFLLGWMLGLSLLLSIVVALVGPAADSGGQQVAGPVRAVLQILTGVVLLVVVLRMWLHRPARGQPHPMPKWMAAVSQMSPIRALGLGALLATLNPKNLPLCISGGVLIAGSSVDGGAVVAAVAVFVVVASLGVIVPLVARAVGGQRASAALHSLQSWLQQHNEALMCALLLVLGVSSLAKGLAAL